VTDTNGNELDAALSSGRNADDLNTLIAPSALHLISAEYVNNQGEIVGQGVLQDGSHRVFLLIRNPSMPLPPTSTPARPRARMRAGLKRIRFHDLRHTFGTLAVQVFPLSDVKAYMWHADIATTMIYVHHVPQLDAASRLSAALEAAAAPSPLVAGVRTERVSTSR
jgi:integrase